MSLSFSPLSIRSPSRMLRWSLWGAGLLSVNAVTVPWGRIVRRIVYEGVRVHGLDTVLLAQQSLAIKLHIASALAALGIGTALLVGVKGRAFHKLAGWSWMAAMAILVVSSFFIQAIHPGRYSYFHLLSAWTAVAAPMAVVFAKRGRIRMHRRFMTGTFVGGLLVAGAFTFMPGRLMWRLFLG